MAASYFSKGKIAFSIFEFYFCKAEFAGFFLGAIGKKLCRN